jgi:hypothetical protein
VCDLQIVDYVARTSLASAFAKPYALPAEIKSESDWQRRMLEIDSSKALESRLCSQQYDILLVDLIDERFDIFERDGIVVTNSVAFQVAQLESEALRQGFRRLAIDNPDRGSMWARGMCRLYEIAMAANPHCLVVMNEVQWGYDQSLPAWMTSKYVSDANRQLRSLYRVSERITGNRYHRIEYESDLFTPDLTHKWGVAPFHYAAPLYRQTIAQLQNIAANRSLHPAN